MLTSSVLQMDRTTYHYENRLLADDTELCHRVDNAQKSIHGLGLLANHGLVNRQWQVVVVEVLLHVLAVDVENVQIHNGKAATPALVALGEIIVLGVEDTIKEREVIFDLLITLDVETILGLDNGSLEV
jgi:archaellum biogenesis ATPase FlaH